MKVVFKNKVYLLVEKIPKGRVMTYGSIAVLCGVPNAARAVGQIAHFGPEYLPWHRVVNAQGGLASNFPLGGKFLQVKMLEKENVSVNGYKVDLNKYIWLPEKLTF